MSASRSGILALLMVVCLALVFQPAPAASAPQVGRYIIGLRGAPLAALAAGGGGAQSLDLAGQPARAQRDRLAAGRQRALAAIARRIGASPPVIYAYDTAFNGMAVELTAAQARQIASLPDVASVQPEQIYQLDTDAGPAWIGADTIWDGSASGVFAATILGENESPPVSSDLSGRGTFSLAGDALSYTVQVSGPAAAITAAHIHRATNDSTVVALTPSATAGTYADSVSLSPADVSLLRAGQLYVNIHTAAHPGGELRGAIAGYQGEGVIIGMIDSGINTTHPSFAEVGGDGYRHLNPLGQGSYRGACDPANLPTRAQGNPSGYNPAISCNSKLIGAWTFSDTAPISNFDTGEPSPNDEGGHGSHTASTAAGNVLTNVTSNGVTYPRISGVAPHANIIAYDVCGYLNGWYYSAGCPGAALLAAVNQAIADKVDVISYSISGGESPWGDPIEQAFLAARAAGIVVSASAGNSGPTPGTVAHLSPWLLSVAAATHNRRSPGGDIMAAFSSRGPAEGLSAAVLKPDLAAPGVSVFAAYANSGGGTPDYALESGTSMAAPHVSGAAALLAGLHPGWTPGQIQSALMTTALAPITKEDGSTPTTPFDSGAGRVRVGLAARAGLVLDETPANFSAADPDAGGDPRALNTPSMANQACVSSCTWVRTLHNALDTPVTWTASTDTASLTVTPPSFTIPASASQVVTFTMDVRAQPFDTYVFGRATFAASGGLAPAASFPVAALPRQSDLPATRIIRSETHVASDTFSMSTIPYASLSVQVYGMAKGDRRDLSIADGGLDNTTVLTVTANTARLVAEVQSSTSQDIDIFVVYDLNQNGEDDSADPVVCQSATEAVEEYCSLDGPAAGTYFVEVQNYRGSAPGATDPAALLTAVVPKTDAGNLSLEAPAASAGGAVSLTLHMDAPTSSQGDTWYGQIRLSDTATSTPIGAANVDFHHTLSGPTSLAASGGAGQRAVVSTSFLSQLQATVTDSDGRRVRGITVTFSAPASGASASFPSGSVAVTDQNGVARVTARANGDVGAYQVTARADGAGGPLTASFALENTPEPLTTYLPLVRR
ncbi:S8 family serine peptidase [Oscillochloris sp. ZM17-4]|uniref:S8 family serine peptidase n=1 Tax=Oscillochloris sp. ZM17-4 TaxID=2866714 RepID=UPI001C73BD69|nr:S8 family serine peptidase [Oscillochloris sp. ZM17-4]MBX0328185.1 S8 family serine peptidase [Oscillochloris sp. ZM17-4]